MYAAVTLPRWALETVVGLSCDEKVRRQAFPVTARVISPGSGNRRVTGNVSPSWEASAEVAMVWAHRNIGRIAEWLHYPPTAAQGGLLGPELDVIVHAGNLAHDVFRDGFLSGAAVAVALVHAKLSHAGCRLVPGVAVTGEINLRGQIIRVGFIATKIKTAFEAGCDKVRRRGGGRTGVYYDYDDDMLLVLLVAQHVCDCPPSIPLIWLHLSILLLLLPYTGSDPCELCR